MDLARLGAKVRELRRRENLTQRRLAEKLDISPSYLNLIEHGKRPLTAPLLIRLAHVFGADLADFSSGEEERLHRDLMQIFAEDLFESHGVRNVDVQEVAHRNPAVARAVLSLWRRFHTQRESLTSLAVRLDEADVAGISSRLPSEEVNDLIERHRNHFPQLESAAEALWSSGYLDRQDVFRGLVSYLEKQLHTRVQIIKQSSSRGAVRRFDTTTRTLYLSEVLRPRSRHFQIAFQIALLEHSDLLASIARDPQLTTDDSRTLCRMALASYFAGAVLFPYEEFFSACREERYDIEILGHRFRTSYEQVCHRMTTLRRRGQEGVPLHLVKIDIAGNITKRFSGSGIAFARYQGACPRWNANAAFLTPGRSRVQISEMPDGQRYFCVARTVTKRLAGYQSPETVHAIGLGCELKHASELVYSNGIDLNQLEHQVVPIGTTCRVCPRQDCDQRAFPSLRSPLRLDEHQRAAGFYTSVQNDTR